MTKPNHHHEQVDHFPGDKMPPKMHKRWIHHSSETLKVANARGIDPMDVDSEFSDNIFIRSVLT